MLLAAALVLPPAGVAAVDSLSDALSGPLAGSTFQASLGGGPSSYRLEAVGRATKPVDVLRRRGDRNLYVMEQGGRIRLLNAAGTGRVVLDVSSEVSGGNEQGLLGGAFSPDGSLLYVNLTNRDGDTEIREYRWSARPGRADATSERLVLEIDQPYANHNGGGMVMDSTGLLWIAVGDGGGGGDPERAGQDRNTLLGKILRIDPRADGTRAYRIPTSNPWADGVAGRPEIWAWGLRNPWRFEVDEARSRVVIGDVGQGEVEEVNVVPTSAVAPNFGWNLREGSRPYDGGAKPEGAIDPVWEATHDDGWCSITGGVTYSGAALRRLQGTHVFADYCEGQLMSLRRSGDGYTAGRIGVKVERPSGFATDADGELLVLSHSGNRVYRLVGR